MAISKGLKRYQFSLEQKSADKLKSLLQEMGAPPNAVSDLLDDYVRGILFNAKQITKAKKRKGVKATYTDLRQSMGYEE